MLEHSLFSLSGHIIRKRRASLSPNMASKLIFLYDNMRKFKYESYEPIDENNDYWSDTAYKNTRIQFINLIYKHFIVLGLWDKTLVILISYYTTKISQTQIIKHQHN